LNSGQTSSGTLLCRFLILCARQRWRIERGKHSSIARIMPGAPSLATKSGSGRPRRRISWRNSRQLAGSSSVPGARCNSAFLPSRRMPHAASTVSRGWPRCIVPDWIRRLNTLSQCIECARVTDGFWTEKGKQLADAIIKAAPEKAAEIAATYLKNPTA
jgi:hypothetical protein